MCSPRSSFLCSVFGLRCLFAVSPQLLTSSLGPILGVCTLIRGMVVAQQHGVSDVLYSIVAAAVVAALLLGVLPALARQGFYTARAMPTTAPALLLVAPTPSHLYLPIVRHEAGHAQQKGPA